MAKIMPSIVSKSPSERINKNIYNWFFYLKYFVFFIDVLVI